MSTLLYGIVRIIALFHDAIMTWNDGHETVMTDKQLHFWVIGFAGIALLLVIYPLFKLLSEVSVLAIAWIYVFTVMIVLTFSIEIGQGITGTGTMDFEDVVAGLEGFMVLFCIFAAIRMLIWGIGKIFGSIFHS